MAPSQFAQFRYGTCQQSPSSMVLWPAQSRRHSPTTPYTLQQHCWILRWRLHLKKPIRICWAKSWGLERNLCVYVVWFWEGFGKERMCLGREMEKGSRGLKRHLDDGGMHSVFFIYGERPWRRLLMRTSKDADGMTVITKTHTRETSQRAVAVLWKDKPCSFRIQKNPEPSMSMNHTNRWNCDMVEKSNDEHLRYYAFPPLAGTAYHRYHI